MEIKSILFPTDFSEGSSQALNYAVDLAGRYRAKLYLFHVIYDIAKASGSHVPHVSMDQLYKDIEQGAKKQLESFGVEELGGFKDLEKNIVKGVPYEEIINFAEKNRIDLIVIGTHGRKGIDRILFGSTAAQIVRFAPCPVLTVRIPSYKT
ncbi:MAG: universal stress protein [Nitrospirae bacterium]|jgi:nucleotide-binding universal stress UspA family protein|nr:universal stress protein [Nitrospirota bacterium]